ncbi:hypothetical protein MTO96_004945 [Rhipicephalus appendiculatus]
MESHRQGVGYAASLQPSYILVELGFDIFGVPAAYVGSLLPDHLLYQAGFGDGFLRRQAQLVSISSLVGKLGHQIVFTTLFLAQATYKCYVFHRRAEIGRIRSNGLAEPARARYLAMVNTWPCPPAVEDLYIAGIPILATDVAPVLHGQLVFLFGFLASFNGGKYLADDYGLHGATPSWVVLALIYVVRGIGMALMAFAGVVDYAVKDVCIHETFARLEYFAFLCDSCYWVAHDAFL